MRDNQAGRAAALKVPTNAAGAKHRKIGTTFRQASPNNTTTNLSASASANAVIGIPNVAMTVMPVR